MEPQQKLDYSQLSPFQLKDELIKLARESTVKAAKAKSSQQMLNAGRGNPNWVATTPREAFFLLGQFALQESKRVWDEPDLGGMPSQEGTASRFSDFILRSPDSPGARLLKSSLNYAVSEFKFDADAFLYELVDATIADNYPTPDRMLEYPEKVVHRFLVREMCGKRPPSGRFDLFATEGGTAAMCYIFNSLVENKILKKGDTIALGTPIFTPYLEIPKLNSFEFKTVEIKQSEMIDGLHTWQYPESEIKKLEDPKIKAFFIVNPSNPPSYAIHQKTIDQIVEIVKTKRPDLLILTDDVYGTFVPEFRSLAADLPSNTILVYSYSKHFGCTGWRLGVIALHENNVIDTMIRNLPESDRNELAKRYGSLTLNPSEIRFIDRMVADSRSVALNHTAGLSLPQQVQMTLFSLFSLLDGNDGYKKRCRKIVERRIHKLFGSMNVPMQDSDLRSYYYVDLDLAVWAKKVIGPEFAEYMNTHHDPLDVVFTLAKKHGTVLLNGSGFDGPPWTIRVSLANLNEEAYEEIGRNLVEVVQAVVSEWNRSRKGKVA